MICSVLTPFLLGEIRLLALVPTVEYLYLLPICAAIAIVNAGSHREDLRAIARHAIRSTIMLLIGIVAFKYAISIFFELILPS